MVAHVRDVTVHSFLHHSHFPLHLLEETLFEVVDTHQEVDILDHELFLFSHAVWANEELLGVVGHAHELDFLVMQRAQDIVQSFNEFEVHFSYFLNFWSNFGL
jgi:hypothetical protein